MDADADDLIALRKAALLSLQGKKSKKSSRKVMKGEDNEDLDKLRKEALMTRKQKQIPSVNMVMVQHRPIFFPPPPMHMPPPHVPMMHPVRVQVQMPRTRLPFKVQPKNLISLTPDPNAEKRMPAPVQNKDPEWLSKVKSLQKLSNVRPQNPTSRNLQVTQNTTEAKSKVGEKFRRFADGDSSSEEDDFVDEVKSEQDSDQDSDAESVKSFSSVESNPNNKTISDKESSDAEETKAPSERSPSPDEASNQDVDLFAAIDEYLNEDDEIGIGEPVKEKNNNHTPAAPKVKKTAKSKTSQEDDLKRISLENQPSKATVTRLKPPPDLSKDQRKIKTTKARPVQNQLKDNDEMQIKPNKKEIIRSQDTTSNPAKIDLRARLKRDNPNKHKANNKKSEPDNKKRRIIIASAEREKQTTKGSKVESTNSAKKSDRSGSASPEIRIRKRKTAVLKEKRVEKIDKRKELNSNNKEKKISRKTVFVKGRNVDKRKLVRKSSAPSSESGSSTQSSESEVLSDQNIGTDESSFTDSSQQSSDEEEEEERRSKRHRPTHKKKYSSYKQDRNTTIPIHLRLGAGNRGYENNRKLSRERTTKKNNRPNRSYEKQTFRKNSSKLKRQRYNDSPTSGTESGGYGSRRKNHRNINHKSNKDNVLEERIKKIQVKNAQIIRRQREIEMEKRKYGY